MIFEYGWGKNAMEEKRGLMGRKGSNERYGEIKTEEEKEGMEFDIKEKKKEGKGEREGEGVKERDNWKKRRERYT